MVLLRCILPATYVSKWPLQASILSRTSYSRSNIIRSTVVPVVAAMRTLMRRLSKLDAFLTSTSASAESVHSPSKIWLKYGSTSPLATWYTRWEERKLEIRKKETFEPSVTGTVYIFSFKNTEQGTGGRQAQHKLWVLCQYHSPLIKFGNLRLGFCDKNESFRSFRQWNRFLCNFPSSEYIQHHLQNHTVHSIVGIWQQGLQHTRNNYIHRTPNTRRSATARTRTEINTCK